MNEYSYHLLANIQKNNNLFPCFAIISYICQHKTKNNYEELIILPSYVCCNPADGL